MTPSAASLKRVFVVACPRSGTTLLQALLARQAKVTTFPETHFFAVYFGSGGRLLSGIRARRALQRASKAVDLGTGPGLATFWRPRLAVETFLRAIDERTRAEGNDGWLEKTPRHVFHVSGISQAVPSAQFIHLLRDGRATIASLYDVAQRNPVGVWERYRSLDYCVQRWNESVIASLGWLGHSGHHFLRYEDLVRDSADVVQRLCADLGISYLADDLAGERPQGSFVMPQETWKAGATADIHDYGLEKYERLFDSQQQQWIEASLFDGWQSLEQRISEAPTP